MSAPQQHIASGLDSLPVSELPAGYGAERGTATTVFESPSSPSNPSRTPISFAVGLHPPVNRREGLFPRNLSRHPLQEAARQCAVQSRRPMVALRSRLAGQNAVADTARDPIHAHRPVPTLLSPDNAWNMRHRAPAVAFDQNPKMNRHA